MKKINKPSVLSTRRANRAKRWLVEQLRSMYAGGFGGSTYNIKIGKHEHAILHPNRFMPINREVRTKFLYEGIRACIIHGYVAENPFLWDAVSMLALIHSERMEEVAKAFQLKDAKWNDIYVWPSELINALPRIKPDHIRTVFQLAADAIEKSLPRRK